MQRLRHFVPPQLRRAARALLRRLTPTKGIRRQPGDPTSFGTVVDERWTWLPQHLPPDVARYQGDIYTKDDQRRLGERLGLQMAETYLAGVPLAEVLAYVEEHALERFVVKPISSYNAIGCRALVATERGFLDLRSEQQLSLEGHGFAMARAYAPLGRRDAWVLEELLLPVDGTLRAVDDYKFYCLGGRVELVLQTRPQRRGKRFKQFHDRKWQPVKVGLEDRKTFVYEVPVNGRKLVQFAEAVASRLAYPFMRIDAYDTTRGIVLGEFTPGPGRTHEFNDEWNDYLLRRWYEAEAALLEGMRSGTITPLGPPSADAASTCVSRPAWRQEERSAKGDPDGGKTPGSNVV